MWWQGLLPPHFRKLGLMRLAGAASIGERLVKKKLFWLFDNLEYLLSMFCMGLMMCLLFIQVISRYVFGYSLAFTEEISVILFILSVYIGAIGGTRRGQHLKIEILTTFLNKKGANCLSDSFRFGVHRGELLPELWKLPGGDKPSALRDADTPLRNSPSGFPMRSFPLRWF